MVAVPALTLVIVPVVPIVATVVGLLLQVPPAVASLTVIVEPMQTDVPPLIAVGTGLTVTVVVTVHPVPRE